MKGSDGFKRLQAVGMLAQELHVSLEEAEKVFDNMITYSDQVKLTQIEASKMVDEMMD